MTTLHAVVREEVVRAKSLRLDPILGIPAPKERADGKSEVRCARCGRVAWVIRGVWRAWKVRDELCRTCALKKAHAR